MRGLELPFRARAHEARVNDEPVIKQRDGLYRRERGRLRALDQSRAR